MDVGLELRQARERRAISLQQISQTTKISVRVLQGIEASDESRLPAPVFTRSFVKTYAAQVGLDPDDTARRYLDQFAPTEIPAAPEPSRRVAEHPLRFVRGLFDRATVLFLVAFAVILLGARYIRHRAAEAPLVESHTAVGATGSTAAGAALPSPVATSGATSAGSAVHPQSLHLTLSSTGPCWVRATIGGKAVVASLLTPGDRRDVDAATDVTLRIGEPGAFVLTINGVPARIPGAPGHPVTVRITRDNYAGFLSR